jgi:DHA1 family multidrug resistance protein-like MFS transporter
VTVGEERSVRRKRLFVLLSCLVVATIGFGITLPVLPFYAERFALLSQRNSALGPLAGVTVQVGLLTAVYPLLQLLVAPLWGRMSDSVGRRRMLLVGIAGAAASYVLFAMATTLTMLYVARALGGLLSSAIFPAASAYVADSTTETQRARGMAWLGTASSLGALVGPALGGALARTGSGVHWSNGILTLSSFSIPFLAAAGLALAAMLGVMAWLPESRRSASATDDPGRPHVSARAALRSLLGLSLAAQFGLALFETTFALFAKQMWRYGPAEVGAAFAVCGLVMSVAQLGVASAFAQGVGPWPQVAVGFSLVGTSLAMLVLAQGTVAVLLMVATLAVGVALVSPNVAALITVRGGSRSGAALGAQGTANGLGQTSGAVLGGLLLAWKMDAPFLVAATVLVALGALVGWWSWRARPDPAFATTR